MEEKVASKLSMVSRLPKFGTRPTRGTSAQASYTLEGKSEPLVKPNGIVHSSSFSLKWEKAFGNTVTPLCPEDLSGTGERDTNHALTSPGMKAIKNPSTPTTKVRRPGSVIPSSSPKTIPKASRTSPKPVPKQAQTHKHQSYGPKITQNGLGSPGLATGQTNSGLLRPRASCSSPRSSSRDRLSQSSDSLKSLTLDNMVRSQSYTHFKQLPSPTGQPMARSFSFNKAVELAKPLANTKLCTPVVRPPQALSNRRMVGGVGTFQTAKGLPEHPATPHSVLKKPLLANSLLNKAASLGYRVTQPATTMSPRPVLVGRSLFHEVAEKVDSGRGNKLQPQNEMKVAPSAESPGEAAEQNGSDPGLQCSVETVEDMSLSSASSLERNDMSEDLFDDIDAGNHNHSSETDNRQRPVPPSQTRLCNFLNDAVEWASVGIVIKGGGQDKPEVPLMISPVVEAPQGSSLELSPSNSSGGTYLWDEEGLEPLAPNRDHCGSYESNINSMDILNNLDNLESCDLGDDDLMLDVDLSEDISLHSDADGMANFDHSERGGRQGHWRRRQHRWSGSDHFHNDNRLQQAAVRGDGHMVVLDELTLQHMAQDCSTVKSQLLKLKNLLQVEDGGSVTESQDCSEDSSTDSTALQLEVLMKEVHALKEELRSKDRTIAQLKQHQHKQQQPLHQTSMKCHCQQRGVVVRGERRTHHDKATQTPWRGHSPPALQPSSPFLSERHTQGRLIRTAHIEDHSDLRLTREFQNQTLSLLLSTQIKIRDTEATAEVSLKAQTLHSPSGLKEQLRDKILTSVSPRQPPIFQRKSPPGGFGVSSEELAHKPQPTGNHTSKQLPPPSRGLPCFNSTVQNVISGLPGEIVPFSKTLERA
ncbi:serine-rich coiled-coil domain-containing protein 2 isoform X3 [Denticeps clupeoides]|uniref:serine-rich coiled-coil domain-containing protein 2 isoform X3 n=1 Tax=Denticeps clupeoides TaxID=299321 RepID=UPI0010A56333|nr:serine-rich coiled-coil domain-containing protein 2 isoform X3 [Denticeps clupeoides]